MAIRERKRKKSENPSLEMTPMIDVVFQLLIFFIVATKQEDILARLNASRPQANTEPPPPDAPPPVFIDVEISKNAVIWMKRELGANLMLANPNYVLLDKGLEQMARLNNKSTVIIRCTADSPHGALVKVLDLCAKHGLTNLNIFSM